MYMFSGAGGFLLLLLHDLQVGLVGVVVGVQHQSFLEVGDCLWVLGHGRQRQAVNAHSEKVILDPYRDALWVAVGSPHAAVGLAVGRVDADGALAVGRGVAVAAQLTVSGSSMEREGTPGTPPKTPCIYTYIYMYMYKHTFI